MANEPLASGSLTQTPFAHVLIYLEQQRMSGTLAVWPDEGADGSQGQDRILLLKGRPMAGMLLYPAASLREGMLRMFGRRQAPYAFYEGNLLGSSENRLSERIEPVSLIAEALRVDDAHDDFVAKVLGGVGEAPLRMAGNVNLKRYDLTAQERAMVDLLMAEPAPINALVGGSGMEQMHALRLLYLLIITKAIAPYDADKGGAQAAAPSAAPEPTTDEMNSIAPAAPDAAPTAAAAPMPAHPAVIPDDPAPTHPAVLPDDPAPATHAAVLPDSTPPPSADSARVGLQSVPPPPESIEEELRARWMKVVAKGKLIENQNYFEMLELPKDSKAAEAKTQFLRMAKEWHPDRLPAELASLKPWVQIIFGYLSEANACLSSEDERVQYLQTVREGGGTPAADKLMERILDSAMEYERVLVFSRKHEYDKALEVLKRILSITHDEPDYHAMYGWLLLQQYPNKPGVNAPFEEILAAFDTAIDLHREHEKAHLYKGQVLRRLGKAREALVEFKAVVKINSNNVEAAREVRIANMRTSQSLGGTKKKDGLFGKLFKK